jgi:hypothetical protein
VSPREQPPADALDAFARVLDELAVTADVGHAVWFATPAAKVEGKIFLALWHGALVARIRYVISRFSMRSIATRQATRPKATMNPRCQKSSHTNPNTASRTSCTQW